MSERNTFNDDALRCLYEVTGNVTDMNSVIVQRDVYRSLVAENEAQAALLRQAVEAMEHTEAWWNSDEVVPSHVNVCRVTITAIRQHLKE